MGPVAADEAIEVFDLLMGDLVRFSGTKANKDRLRTIKELDTAAIVLRHAWMTISRTLSDLDVDLRASQVPTTFLTSAWHRRAFPTKGELAGQFEVATHQGR